MADGPTDTPPFSFRKAFLWTELFRCFQVALDPRKLVVAAAGVLLTSLGWYVLSVAFNVDPPDAKDPQYDAAAMQKKLGDKKPNDGGNYTEAEYREEGQQRFSRDFAQWRVRYDLAGENGRLRTLPWYEYRGPNPFLLLTTVVGGTSVDLQTQFGLFLSGTVPVLIEPLVKLLLPVIKLLDPNADFWTRFYLMLCLVWNLAVWAFCGGVITRIAAVQFAGKDRVTLMSAVQFVVKRYVSYLLSPLVPLGVIAVIVAAMALYGLVAMIPIVGDLLLYGLLFPLIVVGGIAMAILLVGLVGYPLMYTTLSAEGSDTFDALSRSYNYVFQAPWSYLWYSFVAVLYGAIAVFFVVFMGSLMVYLGKWAVSQAPFSEYTNRRPDFLFVYAPESFGWKQLLLDGSKLAVEAKPVTDPITGRTRMDYLPKNPAAAAAYRKDFYLWNTAGAGMVTFWLVAVFLLVIGFSYSYFWSAATMIYLLMRKKVDETELDEIYIEDEALESPLPPPAAVPPASPGATSLPTVPAPVPPPPPPSTLPFGGANGGPVTEKGPGETGAKTNEELKKPGDKA